MNIITALEHLFHVKKDAPDSRDHITPPPGTALPSKADESKYLGPVKNQGSEGSCTAHAGTEYREWLYRKFFQYEKDKTVPAKSLQLSPNFLYGQERLMEGDFSSDGGAQSRTMMKVIATTGCCLESEFPYKQSDMYTMPTPEQLASAQRYAGLSYHRIPDLLTLKSVIVSGYVATLGASVYSSFESAQVAASGEIPIPKDNEQCIGGHETLIFGYDDSHLNLDWSKGALHIRNSWGSDWGLGGNYWLPYKYLDFLTPANYDLWTAHLGKPWIPKAPNF